MPAFVNTRLAFNSHAWRRNPAPANDPSGFDTATGSVLYRGTPAQLLERFPIGGSSGAAALPNAPSGAVMYCLGPQGPPEYRFGHCWAEITWKGINKPRNLDGLGVSALAAGDQVQGVSLQMTTSETHWPQERDGLTVYAGVPYVPAPGYRNVMTITAGGTPISKAVPFRCRIIGRVYTVSVKGITVGTRSAIIHPPTCTIPDPHDTDTFADPAVRNDIPDPLYTYSPETGSQDGWVCRNYQRASEYPMGDKVLAFWTAEYEWIVRKAL